MTALLEQTWVEVCDLRDLEPERGACVLVAGEPVAVVRTYDDEVHAVGNVDPFSGASVLSRGIVGTRGEAPVICSPMYKQAFDLRTGACLDDPDALVRVYPVRVVDGRVHVAAP